MAQDAVLQILFTAVSIDDMALFILREGVNGQIAALQIVFEGNVRIGMADKTGIADAGFAFGTRQSILLAALRMQEHRKIAAYLLVTRVEHCLGGWRPPPPSLYL